MKTRGIEVEAGYLLHKGVNDIPDAIWARVKHEASKQQALDELKADWKAMVEPEHGPGRVYAEHTLFREYVRRLYGPQTVWPWTDGWTEDLVDEYPTQAKAVAA